MTPGEAKATAIWIAAISVRANLVDGSLERTPFPSDEARDQVRSGLVGIAVELYQRVGVQVCSRCGCTDDDPCEQGCAWASADLCTACYADPAIPRITVVSR